MDEADTTTQHARNRYQGHSPEHTGTIMSCNWKGAPFSETCGSAPKS
jgi:hypothetical protein